MSIAFFYPLAWLGALAVGVPIWLHLRRREDPHLVRFSALQFLDDQPPAPRRWLWPRHWPLLLLRLIGLLLLVAAFTWPYLASRETVLIQESRVYILDNTLSNQAGDGIRKARDEIVDQLQRSGPGTQVAVVEIAAQPRVLVGFGDGRAEAVERLRKLRPSHQRGSYLAAFRLADQLLRQSLGAQRRIVLLGDSQENQWSEAQNVPAFLENVEVTLPEVAEEQAANLALMEPHASREFSGERSLVKCTVTLYHQGDRETARVVFFANGQEITRRAEQLSGQTESLTLSAEWEAEPTEWVRGQIRLESAGDALPGDDQVTFALPPVREGRVGLLSSSMYLRTALSPEVMRGRWNMRLLSASDLPLPGRENSELDVLCVAGESLESAEVRGLVLDFLESGRGVFLLVDGVTPVIAGFLRRLSIENLPDSAGSSARTGFRYVFMEHPIFRPFRSADFGNLTEISVQRYRRLKIPRTLPLVFSDAGDPLLLESQTTKGKLLVLAFALDRAETDWPLHPTFVPFLDRCLQHARSQTTTQTDYQPGEWYVGEVAAGRDVNEVVLRASDGADAGSAVRTTVDAGQVHFQVPDTPGLYALSYDDDSTIEGMLAVNPSPLESRLTYSRSPAAVESWQRRDAGGLGVAAAASPTLELSRQSILSQRIWWWLAIGGLVALLAETGYLSLTGRRE